MKMPIDRIELLHAEILNFKSKRLRILRAIEATLQSIKKEDGYSNTVNLVTFDGKSWKDIADPQTPAIFIIDDMVQINRFAGKTREYKWTVRLFGVCKGFSLNEFEEHIADVEECIEDNSFLCGFAARTEINQVVTDNQLFDNTDTRLYEIELMVDYVRCLTHPKS